MKKSLVIFWILVLIILAKEHSILSLETDPNFIRILENSGAIMDNITVHIQFESQENCEEIENILKNLEYSPPKGKKVLLNLDSKDKVQSLDMIVQDKEGLVYCDQLRQLLKASDISSEYFIMVTGTYHKEMDEVQMKNITEKILKETDAKFVEGGFIRSSFLSTSAYTPRIANHIITGTNKINLNIALKYNPSQKQTKLIIATPLIYGDY